MSRRPEGTVRQQFAAQHTCHPAGVVRGWLVLTASLMLTAIACNQSPAPVTTKPSTPTVPVTPPTRPATDVPSVSTESKTPGTQFRFRDATSEWNLDFRRFDDIQGRNLIQEGPGGGLAMVDYDLDGRLDLFFCQGSRLPRTKVTNEFTNELYRNQGRLQRVTDLAGLAAYGFHSGVSAGDVDEDGYPDLYITAYGRSSLWHNNGDGTFQDISQLSRSSVDLWSSSSVLADFNDDGLLDLFVVTYVDAQDDPPRICKEPRSPTGTLQCSPTLFQAQDDVLLINDGQGGFVDVTKQAVIDGKDGKGLAAVACDFTGDGVLDIMIANDGTPQFLYVRKDKQTDTATGLIIPQFEERGAEFGIALNSEGRTISGMSASHGDYDRDGWMDIFITNFYLEPNVLFRNTQGTGFADYSTSSRLGPSSRLTLSFGAEFFDADHDGWLDLVVTTGHIEDRSFAGQEPFKMKPHLFRNDRNGKFTDVAATAGSYFTSTWLGRGLALGDVDRDGDLDVSISHREDSAVLLLNETPPANTSVVIRPVGRSGSPRSGIGTRAIAKGVTPSLVRDVVGGGSFQSASALEMHFPLEQDGQFEQLDCTWPDGQQESWFGVKPGYYVAVQGRGLLRVAGN